MFGELLAVSLRSRGVIGLVTGAGVRDVAELRQVGFPAWARAVSAQGTVGLDMYGLRAELDRMSVRYVDAT